MDGKVVPWSSARVHFLTHSLHYGSAVFEGIRIHAAAKGAAIFRLEEHLNRLFHSAKLFGMSMPYPKATLRKEIVLLARKNKVDEGYIRPLAFYDDGYMGFDIRKAHVRVGIAIWSWEKYSAKKSLEVCISPMERLTAKNTKPEAKISGHYAMPIMALRDALKKGYDSCVLLDDKGNVTEGPMENIFMVKNGMLITPKPGNILLGVTRDTIVKLAKDVRVKALEKNIRADDLKHADEVFFTGTGSELLCIGKIDGGKIGNGKKGKVTMQLEKAYQDVVFGKNGRYRKWLTYL
jgi:branched-chain amino acid aminotransferase